MLELLLALALAQDAPRAERIVVGSKNFAESRLLGEVVAQHLRARTGLEVEHKASLGGTLVCFAALRSGDLDVYPEYTGTAWSIVLHEEEKTADRLRAYVHVQERFRALYDLEWLPPFGIDNSYALAMDPVRAAERDIATVSDLAVRGGDLRAGFSIEFMNREDGYLGLAPFYGLELGEVRALEHGLAYEAVAAGEVDVVDAYTTDGKLAKYDLTLLADDRGFFPPYDAAPVARGELLRAHPEVRAALAELAFALTNERMVALNHEVEVLGRDFAEVARGLLEERGPRTRGPSGAAAEPEPARSRAGLFAFLWSRRDETLRLAGEHLRLVGVAVLWACLLAVPLGVAATRRRWLERASLGASGVVQTIPSLALLALMISVPGLGLEDRSAYLALFLYAVLPILRNTHAGLRAVDPALIDAARAIGLSERQVLLRVQLPLAVRTIMAGVRTATVIGIGVATLAAFIGAGGLGEPIATGLYLNDPALVLSGALPAALLALAADFLLGRVEEALTPRGLQRAERAGRALR